MVLCGAGLYALQNWVILPSFVELEDELARKDLQRCLDAIRREGHHLGKLAGDWAIWDDSYRFMEDRNQEFIDSNLQWETLEKSTGVNLVYFCTSQGEIVWGEVYDSEQDGQVRLEELSPAFLNSSNYLIRHDSINSEHVGILLTSQGPLMVFSRPIVKSNGTGPSNGVFIMGRFLNRKILQTLAEQIHVRFTVQDLKQSAFSRDELELLTRLGDGAVTVIEKKDTFMTVFGAMQDIYGKPALLVTAHVPRDIMARGISMGRLASFSVLITITSVGLLLAFFLADYVFGMRRKTAYIEALIEERTLELKNAMAEADRIRAKAESANKAKSDFLANMSHELRTPLNGIIGMAEIAGNYSTDEEQRKLIGLITAEAGSLLRIINDILDLSKVESGKVELEEIPFDLRTMLHDVDMSLGKQARHKGLAFDINIPADLPTRLKGDPGRLRQVLINLIGNAMKFTHKGRISVTVAGTADEHKRVQLKFQVKDTGVGIPRDKLEIIFNRFTQADESTTRKYGGTGLGTTICREIVELMGGRISVESEVNKGTIFRFTTVLLLQDPATEVVPAVEEIYSGMEILIIDENAVNRNIIDEYLKNKGCRTAWAADYRTAVSLLTVPSAPPRPFDLIITDRRIGDVTGFDLALELRAFDDLRHIPIAMLTSVGNLGDGKRCKEVGIRCYLTRPVGPDDLYNAVQLLMDCARKDNFDSVGGLITKHTIAETFRKKAQILLVEDYPVNQQVVKMHLNGAGYQVDLAENGRQAVEAFAKDGYDLILMDVQMPVLDGFGATREIRILESAVQAQDKHSKRTPIIAMTAHAVKGYHQTCLEAGMDDYITKPFKRAELLAMVAKWMGLHPSNGKRNSAAEAPQAADPADLSAEPMDLACALKEFMGKRDLLLKTLRHFLEAGRAQIETIQKALVDGNAPVIRQEAHKIKGGAANLTAHRLARCAHELEKAAAAGDLGHAVAAMDDFKLEFKALEDHIAGEGRS